MLFIVNNTTFPSLLDLIAPHSCRGCGHLGSPLCECCKKYIISQSQNLQPQNKPKNFPPIYILGRRQGLLDELIQDYKYHSVRALAHTFAELLATILPKNLPKDAVIAPLPTIHQHIRERGLDHTALIAKHLSRDIHRPYQKILIRANSTVQVGTDRKTRKTQASKAYTISPKARINKDTTYILLDDVWTTGASMEAAVKKLQQAGVCKIIVLIIALS